MSDRIYDIPWQSITYEGISFRSIAEVRLHIFLSALGIIHTYEPKTFYFPELYGTDNYVYTPDFGIIANYDFIEYKPTSPTPNEWDKCKALSQRGYKVAIFTGECSIDGRIYLLKNGHQKYIPRTSIFLQQCFQFGLSGKQGETVAALKTVLGRGNYTKAFRKTWEAKF